MSLTTKVIVGCSGVLMSVFASAGIASAAPDVEAIVNSTCTYPQVMAALQAQDPAAASQLSGSPMATGWLQQLVASPPDGRRAMVKQVQAYPQLNGYTALINSVAANCNNF
jgi:hemophore-related protein